MLNNPLILSIGLASSIFLFIVFFAAKLYEKTSQGNALHKKDENDWLFHDFSYKVYGALFGERDADLVLAKFGVDVEEYYANCRMVNEKPDCQRYCARCVYGIFVFVVCLLLYVLTKFPLLMIIGPATLYYCAMWEKKRLKRIATDRKYQIQNELPDFLDLLSAELAIGLPIEQSIKILASRLDNLLAREFMWAFQAMELGAGNWLQSLEYVAMKYDVDTLNDFVSKVSTAFQKGISIDRTVEQEAKDIKKSHLLSIRERANKMTNRILLPIAALQFMPILGFIMIPVFIQILAM